jgi:hypothetical protein
MKFKRIFTSLLLTVLIFSLFGCGKSRDELISAVRNYQVFHDEGTMKTVYDFEKEVKSCADSASVITRYSAEPFKKENEDSFIRKLQQTAGFDYDNKKDYVRFQFWYDFYLEEKDEVIEGYEHSYLFSVDKDGTVTPVAYGKSDSTGGSVVYDEVKLVEALPLLEVDMNAALLTLKVANYEILKGEFY